MTFMGPGTFTIGSLFPHIKVQKIIFYDCVSIKMNILVLNVLVLKHLPPPKSCFVPF